MFDREEVAELLAHPEQIGSELAWGETTSKWLQPASDVNGNPVGYPNRSFRLYTTAKPGDFASPTHFLAAVLRDLTARGHSISSKNRPHPDYAPEGVVYLLHERDECLHLPPIRDISLTLPCNTFLTSHYVDERHDTHLTLVVAADESSFHGIFYQTGSDGEPVPLPTSRYAMLKANARECGLFLCLVLAMPFYIAWWPIDKVRQWISAKRNPPQPIYWIPVDELRAYESACREVSPAPSRKEIESEEQFLTEKALQFLLHSYKSLGIWSVKKCPLCFVGNLCCLVAGLEWTETSNENVVLLTIEEWLTLQNQMIRYHPIAFFDAHVIDWHDEEFKGLYKRLTDKTPVDQTAEFWRIGTATYRGQFEENDRTVEVWRREQHGWYFVCQYSLFRY